MPKKWEVLLPVPIHYSSPVLSIDEKTIYIGTSTWLTGTHVTGQVFVAINVATGKERWRLELGRNEVRSSPAVASDTCLFRNEKYTSGYLLNKFHKFDIS